MSVLNTMLRDLERRGAPPPQPLQGRDPARTAAPGAMPVRSQHPGRRPLALMALLLASGAAAAVLWFAQRPKPEQAPADRHASEPRVQTAAQVPAPVDALPSSGPAPAKAAPPEAPSPENHERSSPLPLSAGSASSPEAGAGKRPSPAPQARAGSSSSPLPPQAGEGSSSSPIPPQAGEGSSSSPLPLAGERPGVRVTAAVTAPPSDAPAVSQSAAQSELTRATDLAGRGRTTEATQVLVAALNKRPDWVDARSMLAALQAEAGDRREALSTLLAGVAADPTRFAPTAAQLQAELEDPAGALQTLDRVPAAARDRPYHALAAAIAQHAGQHEIAVAEYAAALRFDPADSVAWVGLGISLQALGRREQALAAFRGAAQGTLSPDLRHFVEARIRELPSPR